MKFTSDVVIGLEIHVGLQTESKLFCSCPNKKSETPNKHICPICLGHPGSKPSLNKKAIESAIKLSLALQCEIAPKLIFSRKVYFYPDSVKNFQTTQYEEPLGKGGYLQLKDTKIGLERLHVEEDPGALLHQESHVLIDYNRSGTPLCEIVTLPVITGAQEAREFVKKLTTLLGYLDIFSVEDGIIKADLNISIKETDYTRVEIKGVSGLKDIEDALTYEIKRQQESPHEVVQETRGYDTEHKFTFSQRLKETESDYGYIYEAEIAPRTLEKEYVQSIKDTLPELIDERIDRYTKQGLSYDAAYTISASKIVSDFFDKALKKIPQDFATSYVRRDIISRLHEGLFTEKELQDIPIQTQLIVLGDLLATKKINNHSSYEIFEAFAKEKTLDVFSFATERGFIVDDTLDLKIICGEVIREQPSAVEDYKQGLEKSIHYLTGQVMKKIKGKALPADIKKTIEKLLEK